MRVHKEALEVRFKHALQTATRFIQNVMIALDLLASLLTWWLCWLTQSTELHCKVKKQTYSVFNSTFSLSLSLSLTLPPPPQLYTTHGNLHPPPSLVRLEQSDERLCDDSNLIPRSKMVIEPGHTHHNLHVHADTCVPLQVCNNHLTFTTTTHRCISALEKRFAVAK